MLSGSIIFFHITTLEEYGLIKKDYDLSSRGQKAYIIPTGKTINQLEASYYEVILSESKKIIKMLDLLNNSNRAEIFDLLEKDGAKSITDIQKKIGITYNNTFINIKKMVEAGLLETDKPDKGEQGSPCLVNIHKSIRNLYKG